MGRLVSASSKQKRHPKTAPQPDPKTLNKYLRIFFLFIVLFLVKVGQTPQYLLKKMFLLVKKVNTAKQVKKKQVKQKKNSFYRILKILRLKHKKGRPRKKPYLLTYLHKMKRALINLIPKKSRFRIALAVILITLVAYSLLLSKLMVNLPSPHQLTTTERPSTTQILDRNGKLLYQIYEGRNRTLVKLNELHPNLIHATIAIEDKHFYTHPGVDYRGIIRAARSNLSTGQLQGGSTITQQLIKNTLLTTDQTWNRKIKEAILAFWAERIYSKNEILQMYFNEAPYGGPAWGIEAAAEMYFGKKASELDLAESAYLAGLPVAPTEFSPYGTHPEKGKERQKEVLYRMVEDHYISQQEADEAITKELAFNPPMQEIKAPHFVMYIRSLLVQKFGEKMVSQGGLKVITTLDLDLQQKVENIVADQVEKLSELKVGNGAAMVLDAKNGQILAMVGSKNYFDPEGGNFNVALSLRQPGSSIKPITYATAFKEGFGPGTILLDTPTTFPPPAGGSWGESYTPVNYDGRFHGAVSIRTALGSSYNIPAVKTLAMVGLPNMLQTAKDMGITTFDKPENYGLSLTLGGGEVKMIDMMSVYNVFASGGIRYEPKGILTVTDNFGDILENDQEGIGRRALSEGVAYLINNVLSDSKARIPAFGPSSLLEIPQHSVAVKTGTSDDKRDNWAFGFTPEYVVGSWVGNNDNSPMDPRLTSGITGATPIWHDIMVTLLSDKPDLAFQKPAIIAEVVIDGHKDLGITGITPKSILAYKKSKQKDGEKEVITYSDPFTINFIPDQTKTTQ